MEFGGSSIDRFLEKKIYLIHLKRKMIYCRSQFFTIGALSQMNISIGLSSSTNKKNLSNFFYHQNQNRKIP